MWMYTKQLNMENFKYMNIHSFIYSFISNIYIAPLQETYSEELSIPAWLKRAVLTWSKKVGDKVLGNRQSSEAGMLVLFFLANRLSVVENRFPVLLTFRRNKFREADYLNNAFHKKFVKYRYIDQMNNNSWM